MRARVEEFLASVAVLNDRQVTAARSEIDTQIRKLTAAARLPPTAVRRGELPT
jgi:hypothetical protein